MNPKGLLRILLSVVLLPPSINFTSIPYPKFSLDIQWSIDVISDFQQLMSAIPKGILSYILDYIAVLVANGILTFFQAVYYFFAYLEYYVLSGITDASGSMGIFALPVFIIILALTGVAITMVIEGAKDISVVAAA